MPFIVSTNITRYRIREITSDENRAMLIYRRFKAHTDHVKIETIGRTRKGNLHYEEVASGYNAKLGTRVQFGVNNPNATDDVRRG